LLAAQPGVNCHILPSLSNIIFKIAHRRPGGAGLPDIYPAMNELTTAKKYTVPPPKIMIPAVMNPTKVHRSICAEQTNILLYPQMKPGGAN